MIGPGPAVVISDPRIAREYIDKKSGSVSDRPPTYMIDLVTEGKYLTFARYCRLSPLSCDVDRKANEHLKPQIGVAPVQCCKSLLRGMQSRLISRL